MQERTKKVGKSNYDVFIDPASDPEYFKNDAIPGYALNEDNDTFAAMTLKLIREFPYYFPKNQFFKKGITNLVFEDLLTELKNAFPEMKVTNLPGFMNFALLRTEDFAIAFTWTNGPGVEKLGYVFLKDVESETAVTLNSILKKYANGNDGDKSAELMYFYFNAKGEILNQSFYKRAKDFDYVLEELYPGINVHEMVESFLSSKENILILMGPPGIGKTTLIKYLIKNAIEQQHTAFYEEYKIAYCKDADMVAGDQFWVELSGGDYQVLILDDFDKGLVPRKDTKEKGNTFVDKLLSFSDGVFDNKVKIIITTNAELEAIDSAIVRPGRCFDILKLRKLNQNEARVIWNDVLKLEDSEFEKRFGDASEIAQSLLMSEATMLMDKKCAKTYLTENEMSVRKRFEEGYKRTIGFDIE